MNKKEIFDKVEILYQMYKDGKLGGEHMPEDANPGLPKDSLENYLYFTLPMALNYQRNSYILWECALKTYQDSETNFVFSPKKVLEASFEEVQKALVKYRLALQKEKQTEIWITLCKTFIELYDGDIRKLFSSFHNDVNKIRNFIQKEQKKQFPYLSGNKICNYWMYVIWEYTDREYQNMECLTVAPDTHVIKSTQKLGLITKEEMERNDVQLLVIERWNDLFKGTKYRPIDIHTALWLWSRNGFIPLENQKVYEGIFSFYQQYTKLMELERTGWLLRKVPAKRLESVADHTLQVTVLANTFVQELKLQNIDIGRLSVMCFLHDLAKIVVGDIPAIQVHTKEEYERKHDLENEAMQNILSTLQEETATYYYHLWLEFEERKTETSQLAFQVDKLDAVMKARQYSETYHMPELFKEFYETEEEKKHFESGPLSGFFKYLKEEK